MQRRGAQKGMKFEAPHNLGFNPFATQVDFGCQLVSKNEQLHPHAEVPNSPPQ